MIDVKAILARAEAATKGPWTAMPKPEPSFDDHGWRAVAVAGHQFTVAIPSERVLDLQGVKRHEANAAFIAAAREDVPALVAEVERLRGLLRRDCDECGDRPATWMHPTLARGCCDVCGKGQGWIRIDALPTTGGGL
jgi:hypothetical protein